MSAYRYPQHVMLTRTQAERLDQIAAHLGVSRAAILRAGIEGQVASFLQCIEGPSAETLRMTDTLANVIPMRRGRR